MLPSCSPSAALLSPSPSPCSLAKDMVVWDIVSSVSSCRVNS
jgi:hypothetical protein